MKHFDIAIVGAGLVGSSAACALAALNPKLNIALVDGGTPPKAIEAYPLMAPDVHNFDPRVVALTQQSQRLLAEVNAWPLIEKNRAGAYTDMQVWDADGTGHIEFDCSEVQQNSLGHIVENRLLVSALWQCIGQQSNIATMLETKVEDLLEMAGGNQLQLDHGDNISATLVLACDGALSPLRQKMQLATREWDYGHNAIVATIKTEQPHQQTARQRFMASGPLAYLPLGGDPNQQYCSVVWSCQPELADELMALDEQDFCQRIGAALELQLGQVLAVSKRFSIPLRQRHASDYIKPGFALAGDAAHTIHPLAGQGVNLGLQDVIAFAAEIGRALERDIDLAEPSILRRYQRSRKADNLTMMATMEGFKRLFGSNDLSVRWLRNEGMKLMNDIPILKNTIIRKAMGL